MTFRLRAGKKGLELRLHELEATIMDVVWSKRLVSFAVSDVLGILEKKRAIAYTTVMTTVARLHAKGLLARERDGKRYLYSPKLSREQFLESAESAYVVTPNDGTADLPAVTFDGSQTSGTVTGLTNGTASSVLSLFHSVAETLGMNTLGSNEGTEAIARMSPLFGSTTTAAARPICGCRRACSAMV